MKKYFNWMLWAMMLRCGVNAFAQGIVYDSNLGSSSESVQINETGWSGQEIQTGNGAGGYVLDSIQVQMAAASGNPSGFMLSLYSVAGGQLSQSLGALTGSANPTDAGVYTYDASALNLTLAPSTDYFLVESATSPSSQGSYEWGVAFSGTMVDGWQNLSRASSQDQGNDWTLLSGRVTYQMAITATAVPEPSTWMLCLLGGGVAVYVHARKRREVGDQQENVFIR